MDILRHYIDRFNECDDELFVNTIDNEHAYEWLKDEIPLFECPDKDLERTYYFRWWTYRKHVKSTTDGYIITEFLPKVPWSGEHNAILAAVGHHISEGRWLKNGHRYLSDYIKFFLHQPTRAYSYSAWLIHAAWELARVSGNYDFGDDFLECAERYLNYRESSHGLSNGMFYSLDDRDVMEFSISGTTPDLRVRRGIRPTLNSYMCADYLALSRFARRAGDEERAKRYEEKSEALRELVNTELWEDGFYRAFHYEPDETPDSALHAHPGESPRELIGYIPWMFSIPPQGREGAFDLLADKTVFDGPYGLTTAELSHPRFMYEVDHECLWNGYVWPFATSQTLTALQNCINNYPNGEKYKSLYIDILLRYARSHTRTREDGSVVPWIDEVRHPLCDDWSSRTLLKKRGWQEGAGGVERGKDYNHSTFCDLVISGLLGVHEENGQLAVTPNIPDNWDYFTLSNLSFRGKTYKISYKRESGVEITTQE